ncbi:MAG: hypothetical protein ACTSU4_02540 [Promethearchaeota archaeon]
MQKGKKIKKIQSENKKSEILDDPLAFKSLVISAILTGIFLVISLFLNGGIITIFMEKGIIWDVIDIALKVATILSCFFFSFVTLGNFKDITGKPVNWKELLFLSGLALAQTFRSLWVFVSTLIGVVLILLYLYLTQES